METVYLSPKSSVLSLSKNDIFLFYTGSIRRRSICIGGRGSSQCEKYFVLLW